VMGRIRRTIIMGNPRGFVLKKFALIIATWAVGACSYRQEPRQSQSRIASKR
jgi:hypothetical protein